MFGEGYDFLKLKIAAPHAPHRSLVPTLIEPDDVKQVLAEIDAIDAAA